MQIQKVLLVTLIILSTVSIKAQKFDIRNIKFTGNNVVYFEAGGHGFSHSLNYDRRFKKNNPSGLGFRAGISGLTLELGTGGVAFPLGINYIKHIKAELPHAIEIGVGATYFIPKIDKDKLNNTLSTGFSIGYRMQPLEKGLVLKLAYTPLIEEGVYFGHYAAGIGYKF
jgi:hypothetical protein